VQAAQHARIDAVFQMDMIGFSGNHAPTPREFEAHAGFPQSQAVEHRSLSLADLVREAAARLSPSLNPPQVYPDTQSGDDPAASRSDHAPFQERGYAACCVSEDFFVGPKPNSPAPAPNPDYHRRSDRHIDYEYAADIERAVGAAAWLAANR
jgi:leucyl aminopeptidase